jgi:hypothetical protein
MGIARPYLTTYPHQRPRSRHRPGRVSKVVRARILFPPRISSYARMPWTVCTILNQFLKVMHCFCSFFRSVVWVLVFASCGLFGACKVCNFRPIDPRCVFLCFCPPLFVSRPSPKANPTI